MYLSWRVMFYAAKVRAGLELTTSLLRPNRIRSLYTCSLVSNSLAEILCNGEGIVLIVRIHVIIFSFIIINAEVQRSLSNLLFDIHDVINKYYTSFISENGCISYFFNNINELYFNVISGSAHLRGVFSCGWCLSSYILPRRQRPVWKWIFYLEMDLLS